MTCTIETVAYHEAGHAVCAVLSGISLKSVTIKANDDTLGIATCESYYPHGDEYARSMAVMCHAGIAAEVLYTGDVDIFAQDGYITDFEQAFGYLKSAGIVGDDGYWDALEYDITNEAIDLLSEPLVWRMVTKLASELVENETLTFMEVLGVMMGATNRNS